METPALAIIVCKITVISPREQARQAR